MSVIFLARVLGPFILILALHLLLNKKMYMDKIEEFVNDKKLMLTWAVFNLFVGLWIVNYYNKWILDYRGLVTLVAWLTLIKGVVYLLFPEATARMAKIYKNNGFLTWFGVIFMFAVGGYITYGGFFS